MLQKAPKPVYAFVPKEGSPLTATTVPPFAGVQPTSATTWLGRPSPIERQVAPWSLESQRPPVPSAANSRLVAAS